MYWNGTLDTYNRYGLRTIRRRWRRPTLLQGIYRDHERSITQGIQSKTL